MSMGESIQGFKEGGKSAIRRFIDDWGLVLIVILVGLASFGLGRLSALEGHKQPVQVIQSASAAAAVGTAQNEANSGGPETVPVGGEVVASKNGTVYHLPWCSGAQRISASNKVTFASEAEAKAAGYRPAKNCKGLTQ